MSNINYAKMSNINYAKMPNINYGEEVWNFINDEQTKLPIDLTYIAEDICGITLEQKYLANLSGKIRKDAVSDFYTITVNSLDPHTRQRFTIAHEIAHFYSTQKSDRRWYC